jgi:hypothetical protein
MKFYLWLIVVPTWVPNRAREVLRFFASLFAGTQTVPIVTTRAMAESIRAACMAGAAKEPV